MTTFFNLFLLAITPAIAIFIFIYKLDKYDKEPLKLLLKLFFYGMLITVPVIFFERILMRYNFFNELMYYFYIAFVIAGFTEEFFKRYVVLNLGYKNKHYTEKFDGIVYAVIVSLGFATVENILYVVFRYQSYSVGISRALISVPGHGLFAITMGYYLSLAKYAQKKGTERYYFQLSLIVPIILHGIFDFIIFIEAYLFIPAFFIFLLFLYIFNYRKLKKFYDLKEKIKIDN